MTNYFKMIAEHQDWRPTPRPRRPAQHDPAEAPKLASVTSHRGRLAARRQAEADQDDDGDPPEPRPSTQR